MANTRRLSDIAYIKSFALPGGASTTVNSAILDLGAESFKPAEIEAVLYVPALNTTMVPDTRTVTYSIADSTSATFASTRATLFSVSQTGGSSAGVGAITCSIRLPADCKRYVRGTVVSGASTTDMSSLNGEFSLRF